MSYIKKHRLELLLIFIFFIFIGILDYPFLSQIYNRYVQGQVALDAIQNAEGAQERDLREALQKARAYNEALASKGISLEDAFIQRKKENAAYEACLNLAGDGVMGVVEIPRLRVSLPIYHGTSEEVLQEGAGHLEGSSLPVGGADTHACVSAHRGLPSKELFTNLDEMKEGDVFYFKVLGETLAYQVFRTETVLPHQTEALSIREGEDLATLITCTPYGINTHRMYVQGKRIPYKEAALPEVLPEPKIWIREYWWVPVNILLLGWLIFLLRRSRRNKKNRSSENG